MFKKITNKKAFLWSPTLEMNEDQIKSSKVDDIIIAGNHFKMYHDDWKHHIHIKCTDRCDSNCSFCIEKSERDNPQNVKNLLESSKFILKTLNNQGMLRTVSITGGEPMIFPKINELIDIIKSYNIMLLSINTNGYNINKLQDFDGWINISKHAIDDRDVFKRDFVITPKYLMRFRKTHPHIKIRLQCVLGTSNISTINDVFKFIDYFKGYVDDFSFRNLIIDGKESCINDTLLSLRYILFTYHEFVEQVIQDYYVYETYIYNGIPITISWSNMKELMNYNESHNSNFLEEIIVHPDGIISGSWNKKSLVIYTPSDTKGNEYIPCLGKNCAQKESCRRYCGNQAKKITTKRKKPVVIPADSCHSADKHWGGSSCW